MKRIQMEIKGMTCTSCEDHVRETLQKNGAENIQVDYQEGKTEFQLPDGNNEENIREELQK
ncbi:heavy-metal-associated domain-containing protein, partial [Halobacillus trueperi]